MKSINLIVMFLFAYSVIVAQNYTPGPSIPNIGSDNIALKKAVNNQNNFKTLNSRWYDYSSSMDNSNGNIGVLNFSYLFPDTNIYAMFGQLRSKPWVHTIATIIDPTSSVFNQVGQQVISSQDPYLFDSTRIFTKYTRNTNANIVDTLVFEFFTSNVVGEIEEYYFTGMTSAYNVDTVRFKGIPRVGTNLDLGSKVTSKLPLTVLDTNKTNGWNAFSVAVPSTLSVNAGEIVGVSISFRPGYSYSATDTLNNLNFIEIASIEESGTNTYPAYNSGDFNSSQIIPMLPYIAGSIWSSLYVPNIAWLQSFEFENHLIQMLLSTSTSAVIIHESDTMCKGGYYAWHGQNYSLAGIHYDTVLIPNSVDSIYVLNLFLHPSYHLVTNTSILNGDSICWRSNYYSTTGSYIDNYTTINGCDSSFKLELLVSASSQLDIIISEYIEGSGNNRAIELYNPTGNSVNLQNYSISNYTNGSITPYSITLGGIIEADSTYVIVIDKRDPNGTGYDTMVDPALQLLADTFLCPDYSQNRAMYYDGNDAIVLGKNNGTYVDIIGVIGENPGAGWTSDTIGVFNSSRGATPWTKDHSLVRRHYIDIGITNNPQYFNPSVEWDTLPINDFSSIGSRTYYNAVIFSISASSNPSIGGAIIGSGSYSKNQTCNLIAIPFANYKFSNWSENGSIVSKDSMYLFNVNDNRNIVANFELINGINIVKSNTKVDIYPNPNSGKFRIHLIDVELNSIVVINSLGQIIVSKLYNNNAPNEVSVDLHAYPSGIYIINIIDNDGKLISKKIIKK